ncbi:hypothetical protein BDD14_5779 [Edaphobacter modestus]|uniref:Uncharacterized protein n=1 Tax=Edaphobacter modestus TaxID=388466 RepID=A0A4Q7YFB5_9BACT|nr:hypothetical protein BDD14_5779 [Edaphobacter modestus]
MTTPQLCTLSNGICGRRLSMAGAETFYLDILLRVATHAFNAWVGHARRAPTGDTDPSAPPLAQHLLHIADLVGNQVQLAR